jgi:hypothetical protein
MAKEAASKALADAKLPYTAIEQACVGYVYGDSTCGQRAVYELGNDNFCGPAIFDRVGRGSYAFDCRFDRHSYLQCQQQLLDGLHCALHGVPIRARRPVKLCACARL